MKICKVEGCNEKHHAKGYCNKHYAQIQRHGKILDRTVYNQNEIIIYEDYAEMILYDKDNKEIARTLIDLDDVDRVKQYKWRLNDNNYVIRDDMRLHRFIMNCPNDKVVDHINHNRLDNRKSNLRICTQRENIMNRSKTSRNTSGYTGVMWDKSRNKWVARIQNKHLGYFNNKEDAIKVRQEAEIKYFGEYRFLD